MSVFIETERFLMREFIEEDAKGFYELDSDPKVHQYLGNRPIKTMQESENTINLVRKQYVENGIGRWAIIDKVSNEFVGWCGLKYEINTRTGNRYYDLGYRLKQKYWGKGIGTEMAAASLHYGFEHLGLNEIFAAAHIDNLASNKILTKLGFCFLEVFQYDGSIHNWYKIEKNDWFVKYKKAEN